MSSLRIAIAISEQPKSNNRISQILVSIASTANVWVAFTYWYGAHERRLALTKIQCPPFDKRSPGARFHGNQTDTPKSCPVISNECGFFYF